MSTYPSGYEEPGGRRGAEYSDYDLYRSRPQRLTPSRDLGPEWEVVGGPDIKSWDLADERGDRIGTIDDVLVDTDTGRAVFAIARIGGAMGIGGRRTLLPIHLLDLHIDRQRAIAPLSEEILSEAPEITDTTVNLAPFYDFWNGWATTGPAIEEQEAYLLREEVETAMVEPGRAARVGRYQRVIEPEERRRAYG